MEFFERAHVVNKKSAVKSIKVDETVKKQLKQMLHGYKKNDTKIIKEAENIRSHFDDTIFSVDDSDSVSGFSDLNLTNSSIESDKTKDFTSALNLENILRLQSSQGSSSLVNEETSDKSFKQSLESISEYDDDIQSLPEDTQDVNDTTNSDNSIDTCGIDGKITDSNMSDSDSEQFDPDGSLACKILKGIQRKENVKTKKRKLDTIETEISSDEFTENNDSILRIKTSDNKCTEHNVRDSEKFILTSDDNEKSDQDSTDKFDGSSTQDSVSTNASSPYISLIATDMPDQSLGAILGEYRHPTIRNMPCDKQNVIHATSSLDLFSTDNVDITNIVSEDEVDSLVPELGDETTVDELEDELNGTLATPRDESINIDDGTLEMLGEEPLTESTEPDIVNPVKIFYGNNTCIFILKHPTKIYLHGKVKAKALGGTIEVFGYTLHDEFSEIYAPNYNYAQCFKTVECQNAYYGLFRKLTSSGLSVQDAEEIVTTIGDYDGVLSLTKLNSRIMDFVENNITSADLFTKPSKNIENSFKKAFELLGCSLYLTQPGRIFQDNFNWEQAISCGLDKGSRAIVCGGKNTGKSTFLRYYVNKLVANGPVLVIDLDPGQAEMTVAGSVSATVVTNPLIGPNFTHLRKPDKMLNIGMISTMDNPTRYASAVMNLFEYCHSNDNYRNMPWVINTMGMCNNLGLKFITLTIFLAQPTLLVQMDSTNQKKRFEIDLYPLNVQNFLDDNKYDRIFKTIPHVEKLDYTIIVSSPLEIKTKVETALSVKEERYLNFLAYFGQLMDVHSGPGILGIVPYEVRMQDLNIGTNVHLRKEAVTRVINGKIIALCQLTTPDKGRVFNLRDNAVPCLGHGLVRGVDFDKGLLYIVTPAPVDTLLDVNTLVYSDWVPDLKGQDNQLPEGTIVPYRTTSKQRHLMIAPHRRFNPLQLLKMSRKS